MGNYYIRTEDILTDDLLKLFVESIRDRQIIDAIKGPQPVVLVGSRGVGKSFLLKVACAEQKGTFAESRVFPVYVSFTKGSLVQFAQPQQFQSWMLAKLCNAIVRALGREGLLVQPPKEISILAGQTSSGATTKTPLETVEEAFETSWKSPDAYVDTRHVPDIDSFKEAIEDICRQLDIKRITLQIDEAAHVFIPQQQRAFFTLFRDLRSPYITCNAAIYPGVTAFGDTFQPAHDATFISIDRDVLDSGYVETMREIVEKQADSDAQKAIARNGRLFAILAYAASGNPRLLLKTFLKAPKVSSSEIDEIFRTFYRSEIWGEHSILAEKYPGHKHLIDWGRNFIETIVLPEIQKKNLISLEADKNTSSFFWIHRDAPIGVKHALQILSYTGIVNEHAQGMKATRGGIGTRYSVNLGCLFSLEAKPSQTAFEIAKSLSIKRMTEFGANHSSYVDLASDLPNLEDVRINREALTSQLGKSSNVLDITEWQKRTLRERGLNTVKEVLLSTEEDLQRAHYVGVVRSRQMRNAAEAAVFEYLSG
ncbi:MAG: hypothetical protein OEL53_01660 [Rhodospirillales bacterium]|nr:hypothetical protein [Rhodospirillales bacterium]